MKPTILILLALVTAAATFMSIVRQKRHADLLILNAVIHTVNEHDDTAEAVAVRGSRIVAVGTTQDIENQFTSQQVIDAAGRTVIPGIIDAHAHVLGLGQSLTELDLVGTHSAEEIAAMVAARAKELPPGEWIRGRGWDQNDWGSGTGEKPFPSAAVLDKAAPDHPVILSRIDGHAIWVNSRAMELAAARSELTHDVEGGRIVRDRLGRPTGVFVDNAESVVRAVVPDYTREEKEAMYRRAFDECLRYGITGVHDMGIDETDDAVYRSLAERRELPLRIYALVGGTGPFLDRMLREGPKLDPVHHYYTLRSIKLYLDGALGSRGAALIEPYSDEPESRGLITADPDTVRSVVEKALQARFQVCIHAIGDRANRKALDAYEKAAARFPAQAAGARLRIEHAQIIAPEDIPRFASLGVIPSMQPVHATSDMYWAQARLGPERILGAYAWRSLLDAGCIIPAGSDFPVERPDPFAGFYAAVTRQDAQGYPRNAADVREMFQLSADGIEDPSRFENGWYAAQRMTRREALRAFTLWGAYAEFASNQKGSIEEGKLADMVLLDRDIMSVPPKEILSARVLTTIVGGKVRYQQPSGGPAGRR